MTAKARARRWITKQDPDDPVARREHARRIDAEARKVHRPRLTKAQQQLVHAAREQLAAERKAKTAQRRRKAQVASRRKNR